MTVENQQGGQPQATPVSPQPPVTPTPVGPQGQGAAAPLPAARPVIRSQAAMQAAATAEQASATPSQSAIGSGQSMSRPQVPVTSQAYLDSIEAVKNSQQEVQKEKNKWWSIVNKKMFIVAILITGGAVFALWAIGGIFKSEGLTGFIEHGGFMLLLIPIFVAVMAILMYLEKERIRNQGADPFALAGKSPFQETKESDEDYKARMQAPVQYGATGKPATQAATQPPHPSPQPASSAPQPAPQPKPAAATQPVLPQPEPEYQAPKPLEPIEFTSSQNALPISRDGGAAFQPQNSTKIQTPPSQE